jgi:hypothetical protein
MNCHAKTITTMSNPIVRKTMLLQQHNKEDIQLSEVYACMKHAIGSLAWRTASSFFFWTSASPFYKFLLLYHLVHMLKQNRNPAATI